MEHEGYMKLQEETFQKAVDVLKGEPRVSGVVLYGSLVQGTNDAFSDIDMICYLSEPDDSVIGNLIGQIEKIHPLLSKLWIFGKNSLFLFNNGIRLDLDLLPDGEIQNLQVGGMRILYDPQGIIASGIHTKKAEPPAHPKYFRSGDELPDWFFWMFRQVCCWTKRGARNNRRSFEKLYAAFVSLNEMRQTLMEMRRWTLGTDGDWQDDDSGFYGCLLGTFPSLKPAEMMDATRTLFTAFEFACNAYCIRCGTGYPREKIETMKQMLDMFDALH